MTNYFWDKLAPEYDRFYTTPINLAEDAILTRVAQEVIDLTPPGGQILDVACGTGWLLDHVKLRGRRYTGVDQSAEMLAGARLKHPHGTFIEADACRLVDTLTTSRRHAAVICLFSSQFFPEPHHAIANMNALTVPGGRLLLTFQAQGSRLRRHAINFPVMGRFLTTRQVRRWLIDAGYTDIAMKGLTGPVKHAIWSRAHRPPVGLLRAEAATWGRLLPDLCDHVVVTARKRGS